MTTEESKLTLEEAVIKHHQDSGESYLDSLMLVINEYNIDIDEFSWSLQLSKALQAKIFDEALELNLVKDSRDKQVAKLDI